MTRVHAKVASRRLLIVGLCLLSSLVVATSLAWACAPSSNPTAATPRSGPAGTVTTVSGDGVDGATTVDIHWQNEAGPVLAKDVPITGTVPRRLFSTDVTIPGDAAPGPRYLHVVQRNDQGDRVPSLAPQVAPFEVTRVAINLAPASGLPGTSTVVSGTDFATVPVKIRWGSPTGPVLGTTNGPEFTRQVTIPAGAAGNHSIFAVPSVYSSDRAAAVFRIIDPLLPPPPGGGPGAADNVGPAIAAAALSRQNGTRTVSRSGVVRVFCGSFTEPGVAGTCGARSVRALKLKVRAGGKARSVVLRLPAKRFNATVSRPVMLKFRLSKSSMKMLKAAKKVRMRGTLDARDANGNPTKVPFRFTLKAPKSRSK